MKKRKSDFQLSEAKDWGTLEISDENDLIKLIKKIAKKSKPFLKKADAVLKELGKGAGSSIRNEENEEVYEAKDWGTLEISDENDLIKLIKKIAKKSKSFLKKANDALKDTKANKVVESLINGYVTLERNGEVYEAVWYNNAVTILKDSAIVESLSESVFKSNLTNENFIVSDLVNENKSSKFVIGQPLRYGGMETVVCGISESVLTLDIDGEKININQKEL